jgi:spore coat protein CotH/sugar lactone lactonase YvrE
MRVLWVAGLIGVLIPPAAAPAAVVINEIFYHAPDGLDPVQWIELHNTADQPVNLSGWSFNKGAAYTFPEGSAIEPQGYLVVAGNPERFQKLYEVAALGPLARALKKGSGRIVLLNRQGEEVDAARYKDHHPWPASADGASASLERICPSASGEAAENWAASPLPPGPPRPAGTPGRRNSGFSAVPPPVIELLSGPPDDAAPGQPLAVEARVKDQAALKEVDLLYRVVTGGVERKELEVAMARDGASGLYRAAIPAQAAKTLVRYRIRASSESGAKRLYPGENDLRTTWSVYVHEPWEAGKIPFGFILHAAPEGSPAGPSAKNQRRGGGPGGFFRGPMGRAGPREAHPARGSSAFVFVDPKTGKTELFDHLSVIPREGGRGYKVHFHKDREFQGMSVVSIIFEGSERFLLAEALAYDVYRRAGNAAPETDFIRLWVDGRLEGYHLMIEQPNRAFLKRNKVRPDGNLYKLVWFGRGVAGQHRKKTSTQPGHGDLLAVIERLQKTSGEEQWKVIQESFNVPQVATYFAVNTVLSHWDGFFNNYFTYHDLHGTNRWEMYPWDQDKTWGYYDGIRESEVFFNMPLTFGMEGDAPPATPGRPARSRGGFGGLFGGGPFGGGPFGGGPMWWRPGGHFSKPLLANPEFRKVFLARTREVLEKVYTREIYFPLIDQMAERLREDVKLRAEIQSDDGEEAERLLEHNVQSLRSHLEKRREFLLNQEELRSASPPVEPSREPAPAYRIDTIAGNGSPGDLPAGGAQAREVPLDLPFGVERGAGGAIFITTVGSHRVLRLDKGSGRLTPVAGNGRRGYSGDGGPATEAALNEPYEVRLDSKENLLIVEMQNHLVRRVDHRDGTISTVAGDGTAGFQGDGGPARGARFHDPHSLILDESDNIYISDLSNHRVRRIDARTGIIETLVGNGKAALPRDGGLAREEPFLTPQGLVIRGGRLWIATPSGQSLWRVDLPDGAIHRVAGSGQRGWGGDGGDPLLATFDGPRGMTMSPSGVLYLAEGENNVIRMVDTARGSIRTLAGAGPKKHLYSGDEVPATEAALWQPHGVALLEDGEVLFSDTRNHRLRRLRPVAAP